MVTGLRNLPRGGGGGMHMYMQLYHLEVTYFFKQSRFKVG